MAVVALLMMGLGVKMIFKKQGEFKRHCSSMDPCSGDCKRCADRHPTASGTVMQGEK